MINIKNKLRTTGLLVLVLMTILTNTIIASQARNEIGENTNSKIFDKIDNPDKAIENVLNIPIENNNLRISVLPKEEYSIVQSAQKTSIKNIDENEVSIDEVIKKSEEIKEQYEIELEIRKKSYSETTTQGGLVDIQNPDSNYTGKVVKLSDKDRDEFEKLLFGEAGGQGFVGQCLVAQCLRDMWIEGGYTDARTLRLSCGYEGSIHNGTSQSCKDAIYYIFDQGGYAVKHRVFYFYAFNTTKSNWHESQTFVIQYLGHRFFDRRW